MLVIMWLVIMVMMMGIGRYHARCLGAKELGKFRILLHAFRPALTADMAIEADHMIAFGHDHVQIMAHHENAAAMGFANAGNQFVKFHFAE